MVPYGGKKDPGAIPCQAPVLTTHKRRGGDVQPCLGRLGRLSGIPTKGGSKVRWLKARLRAQPLLTVWLGE